jgi:DNA polymerase III subunit epsilon
MDAPEARALLDDLVFVDLETTGANPAYHRITEIGIVRVRAGVAVEEWSTLVNPESRISDYIERFTGISNEMVATAPRFAEIGDLVLEKLQPRAPEPTVFVAHNARFDYAFLRAEFRRLRRPFSAKVLCTVKLSRRLFPEHIRHGLDAVMERHDLVCSARHRALGDARVIGDFWLKLKREQPEATAAAAAACLLAPAKLPPQLPEGLAEELPEGPGVYRFFGIDEQGQEETLLYVGKSHGLRSSILGHFADGRSGRDRKLIEAVRRIDWQETAGELGAGLREIECLKSERPLYNRHLKSLDESVTLRVSDEGAVELVRVDELAPVEVEEAFGVFHSHKDARKALGDIAAARGLCPKVLGLETAEGSCLGYHRGRCKGACIGKEPLVLHTLRLRMALSSLKLKPWPFAGRVALRERGPFDSADLHIVDRWRYLGTARSEEELAALTRRATPEAFDAHVYRILVRHFAQHPKLDWHGLEPHAQADDAGPDYA